MSAKAATDASEFDPIEEALQQGVIICADPDFSNFARERAGSSFAVNQVWAVYDFHDGMPRSYVRVKKVCTRGFKLKITWLDPFPVKAAAELKWGGKDLPVGCGRYQNGETEITVDRLMFSHQMDYTHQVQYINGRRGGCSYFIYPKTGETWALFKEWDDGKGSSKPKEKHRFPCQFEFVEVLTDFGEDVGVVVAYLQKVKGFVSIFQKANCDDVLSFCILPSKMYRFSHRVPSVRMSGKEREGVSAGSFEFDTRALPSYFASLVDTEKICSFINVVESGPENGNSALASCPKDTIGTCTDDRQVEAGQQAKEQVGIKVAATCNQFLDEKRVIIQAPSKVMLQNYAGKPPDVGSPHRFYGSVAMLEEEKAANAFEYKPKEVKVKNAAGVGGGPIPQKKVNGNMHIEAGKGVPVSKPDAMKHKESGKSESTGKKRCHELADEPSKNFDKRKAQLEESVVCAQISGSRSSSQKQHISYKGNLSHPDFLVPPTKKRLSGNNSSNMTNGEMKESTVNGRIPKEGPSAAFATSVLSRNNKEVKQKARLEEMSSNKKSKLEDSMSKAEEASSMSESNGTKSENDDEGFKTRTSESKVEEASSMSKSGGTKSENDDERSETDISELDPIETLK